MSTSVFDVDEFGDFFPEPPPPTDYDVEVVIGMFEQVRVDNVAWALSGALHSLDIRCFKKDVQPLGAEARIRVLTALERAYRVAWRHLPREYPRERLVAGMRGSAALVGHWSCRRKLTRMDYVHDARALARCLRNDCHNMSLIDEIDERAVQRELFGADTGTDAMPAIAFLGAA